MGSHTNKWGQVELRERRKSWLMSGHEEIKHQHTSASDIRLTSWLQCNRALSPDCETSSSRPALTCVHFDVEPYNSCTFPFLVEQVSNLLCANAPRSRHVNSWPSSLGTIQVFLCTFSLLYVMSTSDKAEKQSFFSFLPMIRWPGFYSVDHKYGGYQQVQKSSAYLERLPQATEGLEGQSWWDMKIINFYVRRG